MNWKLQLKHHIKHHKVTLIFLGLALLFFLLCGLPLQMLVNDLVERLARNLFLVLSLLLPLAAGMGINFALPVGALCAQLGFIGAAHLQTHGLLGIGLTLLIALPLSCLSGSILGFLMNRAKGREMITGLVAGYFFSGIYQCICLALTSTNPAIANDMGKGIKNTIDLRFLQYSIDNFPMEWKLFGIRIPLLTLFLCTAFALWIHFFLHSKQGQHMRAVNYNADSAKKAGISINASRFLAIVVSTAAAAIGQVISLQNIGSLSTFGSHEQIGLYAAAALLAGGATLKKATPINAVVGVVLFYLLFITAPKAMANLFGEPQIGEFFRVFITYAVIVTAIIANNNKQNGQ